MRLCELAKQFVQVLNRITWIKRSACREKITDIELNQILHRYYKYGGAYKWAKKRPHRGEAFNTKIEGVISR